MADLVPLEKAAQLLGISAEELNNMRLRNEVFGTRDGSDWKFKMDELARVAADKGITLGGDDDSDFELSEESAELMLDDSGSGSNVLEGEELEFGTSDIKLAAGSDKVGSGSDKDVLSDDQPSDKGSPSDTGKLLADSGDLELSEDDLFDDDLSVKESRMVDSSDLSSDFEDSDLVLEDSDSSDESAVAESGVNLSPTESGISDEAFELGGSDIDSLELPEDEDVLALDDSMGSDSATLLKSDDDFNLTPLEDDALDDSSSGSQVIALEDSAIYTDESTPTVLGDSDQSFDTGAAPQMLDAGDQAAVSISPGAIAVAPEAPYTVGNILALALALFVVSLATMLAFDLARNMWQPADTSLTNTIANFFVRMAGYES